MLCRKAKFYARLLSLLSLGVFLLTGLFLPSYSEGQTNVSDSAVITSDITNGLVAADSDANTPDVLVINSGVTVSDNLTPGLTLNSAYTVFNDGTISSGTEKGVLFNATGTMNNTGSIAGNLTGVKMTNGTVNNTGTISSVLADGIDISSGTVTNGGTVDSIALTSGTITNTGTVLETGGRAIFMQDGTITNSGSITGTNGLLMEGDVTVNNSGAITGTSGTALLRENTFAGTLNLDLQTGWAITGDISGGTQIDTLNLMGTGSFADDFSAWEIFTFDSGTFHINGTAAFTTSTDINGGTLFINNTLTSTTVTVNSAGTLGGTGTITGNLTNNGGVTPGNSIGTLSLTGNYSQGSGGNLEVEFNNASSDVLATTGSATINGKVTFVAEGTPLATNNTYSFVTTTGGVTGSFSEVVTPVFFTSNVSTVSNNVQVVLTRKSYQTTAITDNQKALAAGMDSSIANASGDLALVLTALDNSATAGDAQSALNQLSPEPLTVFSQASFNSTQAYTNTLVNRLGELRSGSPTSNADTRKTLPMFAFAGDDFSQFAQSLDDNLNDEYSNSKPWMPFIRTFGVFSSLGKKDSAVGFDSTTAGLAVGADRAYGEKFTVGASLGGAWTSIDYEGSAGMEGSISAYSLAGYISYTTEKWYVDGILSYALNTFENKRTIQFGGIDRVAESDHSGNEISTYMGGGYLFNKEEWTYGPTASFQYIALFEDGYTETGAGAAGLTIDSSTANSFETTLGGRVSRRMELESGMVLLPQAYINWAHEWAETEHTITAQFTDVAGSSFDIKSRDIGSDSFNLGTGMTAFLKNDVSINLEYAINFGRDDFTAHSLSASAQFRF